MLNNCSLENTLKICGSFYVICNTVEFSQHKLNWDVYNLTPSIPFFRIKSSLGSIQNIDLAFRNWYFTFAIYFILQTITIFSTFAPEYIPLVLNCFLTDNLKGEKIHIE